MKAIVLVILVAAGVWAQAVPGAAAPQAAPAPALPNLPEETVLVTFEDGGKLTMGDFRKLFAVLPPDTQQMALRDRKMFFHQWGLMRKLGQLAEQNKLEEQSPTREALMFNRMLVMSQAQISETVKNTTVENAEVVKYYDINKANYKLVRVKAIYIGFNNNPAATGAGGKKPLTEEQASAKAAKLVADLRTGADFIKLAKENSDDEASRNKDGDFATLRASDNIPDALKSAVFALKQGELTEPVRQPNGFYIFRAEEITVRPLSSVREEIYNLLKDQRSKEWMDKTNRELKVTYNSPEFFGAAASGK
jgi:peptidyl-prolyl cis-trans isomerase C